MKGERRKARQEKWAAAEAGGEEEGGGEERKNKTGLFKYILIFKILQDSMICKYV